MLLQQMYSSFSDKEKDPDYLQLYEWYMEDKKKRIKTFLDPVDLPSSYDTYDANGNMTSDALKCYEYNEANQLKKVKRCADNQTIVEYVYDFNGKRIIKKNYSNGNLSNIITSWTPSFETKAIVGGATDTTIYFYANSELVAKKNPDGSKYYYHNDHLGSSSILTNQAGSQVESTTYDPWGKLKSGGTQSRFLYTGQEHDTETGLDYYNARYYSSDIRRFTQPDDIIQNVYDPQSLNRYSYVNNNPLRYTDPTGHVGEILAYNSSLNDYYKKPSAKTYNNVLNTARDIQKNNYQPEKDKGVAKDVAKPVYNTLLGNDVKTLKNSNATLSQKSWAGVGILGNVYLPAKSAKFVSATRSTEHFIKHGAEMGYKTEAEYVSGANKLFEGGDGVGAALRTNGDALFYREATKEFGIITPDNIIRTYFSPKAGMDYFLREISK